VRDLWRHNNRSDPTDIDSEEEKGRRRWDSMPTGLDSCSPFLRDVQGLVVARPPMVFKKKEDEKV